MSVVLNINGTNYDFPESGDEPWANDVTDAIVALANSSNTVYVGSIVNDLVSTDIDKPLSANMGKTLKDAQDLNTTHRTSDGKDHSDVVLNNTHRTGNGTDHSQVTINQNAISDVTVNPSTQFALPYFSDTAGALADSGVPFENININSNNIATNTTNIGTNTTNISNNDADILALETEQPTGFKNLIIDGDFNHNQSGVTSQSQADGEVYKTLDVWQPYWGSALGTFSIESHPSTNSKPNYLRYSITSGTSFLRIKEFLKGNSFSNKTLSVFMRCKYQTSAPTGLVAYIKDSAGTTFGSSSIITGITDSWGWVRRDITVTAFSSSYQEFRLMNTPNETWDLDIDKIRVIETPANLPADVIPEWIKQDEDPLETLPLVQSYYYMNASTQDSAIALAVNKNVTTATSYIPLPFTMVQMPSLDISAITDFTYKEGVVIANTTNVVLAGQTTLNTGAIIITVAGGLTGGNAGFLKTLATGTPHIAFDARY